MQRKKGRAGKTEGTTTGLGHGDTQAAAFWTGLAVGTLQNMRVHGGGPPFVRLGNRIFYRRDDVESWIAGQRRLSTSDSQPSAA